MQAVVSEYVHLEKKGGRLWGLCPFHSEKTPSFTVDPDKSVFYCFGCHKGGSLFTFVMEMEKLSFVEAVKLLGEKAGGHGVSPVNFRLSGYEINEMVSRVAPGVRHL